MQHLFSLTGKVRYLGRYDKLDRQTAEEFVDYLVNSSHPGIRNNGSDDKPLIFMAGAVPVDDSDDDDTLYQVYVRFSNQGPMAWQEKARWIVTNFQRWPEGV